MDCTVLRLDNHEQSSVQYSTVQKRPHPAKHEHIPPTKPKSSPHRARTASCSRGVRIPQRRLAVLLYSNRDRHCGGPVVRAFRRNQLWCNRQAASSIARTKQTRQCNLLKETELPPLSDLLRRPWEQPMLIWSASPCPAVVFALIS